MVDRQQHRLEEFGSPEESKLAIVPTQRPPRPAALPGIWGVRAGFVEHPLLRSQVVRALPFQIDLARVGLEEDLLVVLPTGLGKTVVAALIGAELLRRETGKLLFLAPTRPLVHQHAESFGKWFDTLARSRFTGTVKRPVREGAWETAEAIFATPEIIANDLAAGRFDLKEVGLLVFDEAHHAVGKYAYVSIAERYKTERPRGGRVLGLTASPGGKDERIEEVVGVLGVQRIEARSREDEGVREFVQPVTIDYRWVKLTPSSLRIQELLVEANREEARKLQKMGYLRKKPINSLSVKDLISLRAEIFARPGPMTRKFGPLYHQLLLLHLHHALERLETQGIEPFLQYVTRVETKPKAGKGDKAFVKVAQIVEARRIAREVLGTTKEASHPKLDALVDVVQEEIARHPERPPRILVFAQYRDTIQGIQDFLEAQGWTVGRFVGQATRDSEDKGMNQKEQAHVLSAFRDGRFPLLVASSVAEEGLDVPDVDIVVFFEAVPSEIRAIQRRGRTGRSSLGRVVVLLTEATRDVGYQRAESRREMAMKRIVRRLSVQGRLAKEERERRAARPDRPAPAPVPGEDGDERPASGEA